MTNADKDVFWVTYKRPLGPMRMLEVGVAYGTQEATEQRKMKLAGALGVAMEQVKETDDACEKVAPLALPKVGTDATPKAEAGKSTTGKPCPSCGKDMTHRTGETASETEFVKDPNTGAMTPKVKAWAGWFCPDSKKDGSGPCKQKPIFTGTKK